MKMDDEKLKRILQEAAEWEADQIMEEVNSDPNMHDVEAPELIHERLFRQIHEHEASKQDPESALTEEQKEYIRLGKKYEKKLSRRKYYVLIAAVVCALAAGMVSFGDGKKVVQEVKNMIAGKTQVNIDDDSGQTGETKVIEELEVFQEIEEKFGFYPVQMDYLPEGMEFVEAVVEEEKQSAILYYEGMRERNIAYKVVTNFRAGSIGMDVEDTFVKEYEKVVNAVTITIKEYWVEERKTNRWLISFDYQGATYWMLMMGLEVEEVEKIVDNFYFS